MADTTAAGGANTTTNGGAAKKPSTTRAHAPPNQTVVNVADAVKHIKGKAHVQQLINAHEHWTNQGVLSKALITYLGTPGWLSNPEMHFQGWASVAQKRRIVQMVREVLVKLELEVISAAARPQADTIKQQTATIKKQAAAIAYMKIQLDETARLKHTIRYNQFDINLRERAMALLFDLQGVVLNQADRAAFAGLRTLVVDAQQETDEKQRIKQYEHALQRLKEFAQPHLAAQVVTIDDDEPPIKRNRTDAHE